MNNAKQVKLQLINRSNDSNNSSVVIFQKNVAGSSNELPVVWRVIQNLGIGDEYPFLYSHQVQVNASDSWGNYTFPVDAESGLRYQMQRTKSGNQFVQKGPSVRQNDFEVKNALPMGSINAHCYRDGLLVATKTSIPPEQKVEFQFKYTIFIGIVSQIEEDEVMNSAILSDINTEISLLGILSADIVITGGGPGNTATAFQFNLENVQYG